MRIDDNVEALAMMNRALGSLESKFREAYNKGFHDGRREGMNLVKREIADKILGEVEDEPKTDKVGWKCEVEHRPSGAVWIHHSPDNEDEPQIDRDDLGDCNICKYVGLEHRCNRCVNGSHFCKVGDEPKTEELPQDLDVFDNMQRVLKVRKTKPQTEREGE